MSVRDEQQGPGGMGARERFVWQAAVAALSVHVLALFAVQWWGGLPAPVGTAYAEVEFADYTMPEQTRTMEEAIRDRLEERMQAVRNVSADASAARSDELRSSTAEERRLAEEVEAELRAFEQSAFDALADGRDGEQGVPDPQRRDQEKVDDRYENWDARYDGQVTAEYDLAGRKALELDIPGYRCRGGGVVVVSIEVDPGGNVLAAEVRGVQAVGTAEMSECLAAESLRSARRCRFQSKADAPRRQVGTLTYRFIAQ